MATAFGISRSLISQGADSSSMAQVLESLTEADKLPVWGPGAVGAELTPAQIVAVLLGSTAANPAEAAAHVAKLSVLVRADGRTLPDILEKIIIAPPNEIYVNDVIIATNGSQATVRYQRAVSDIFYGAESLSAFTHSCVIRNSVVQMLAMKISHPTKSGWVERLSDEHEE